MEQFLTAVGSDPTQFPAEFLDVAEAFTPVLRNARPFHDTDLPYAELAAAPFPKLVVSGGQVLGERSCLRSRPQLNQTLTGER